MPAIRTLNEWAESIRQSELSWLPEDLPPETRAHVEKLTKRLVKRLLGRAAARVVKGHGEENPNLPTADDLRSVFSLAHSADEAAKQGRCLLAPQCGHSRVSRELCDEVFVFGSDQLTFSPSRRALLVRQATPQLTHEDIEQQPEVAAAEPPRPDGA